MAWNRFSEILAKYNKWLLRCEICKGGGHLGVRTYDGKRRLVCYSCQVKRAEQKERDDRKRRRGQNRARRRAIEKRGNNCGICSAQGVRLNFHHKIRLMDGGDHRPSNTLLLCDGCHEHEHVSGTRW